MSEQKISVYLTEREQTLIREAATSCGVTTEEFVLWAATTRASEDLENLRRRES